MVEGCNLLVFLLESFFPTPQASLPCRQFLNRRVTFACHLLNQSTRGVRRWRRLALKEDKPLVAPLVAPLDLLQGVMADSLIGSSPLRGTCSE